MSAAAIEANDLSAPSIAGANPWLIAIVVALASFMEVLDTTIANVALPYIAGGMGVSEDEASWVVTTYLVSNAIVLTASSFLARMLGRKAFFLICLGLFTLSSILCGFAPNLNALLLFRILQGFGGGGMVPVAQSILADVFPPAKRGQAFALFGVAVVVAPVVGPTLGGWISDNWSWQWCFLINAPVGVLAMALIAVLLSAPKRQQSQQQGNAFDIIGFILGATFLGALEVVLDRGLEDDWFASRFIVTFSVICAAAFVVMLITGAILLATTQFLPQLVQQNFGYTATWAGLPLSPGGLVTMAMMFVVGRIAGKVQPKYLIVAGAVLIAASMYQMTNVYGDLGFWYMARSRMLLGVGLPLIFVPIMTASYDGIAQSKTDQASALINAARNTGSSIGVSIVSNVLTHRQQFHQSRLVESVLPSSVQYQDTLHRVTDYFVAQGNALLQAQQQAIQWIGQQVQTQASFLAYMDVFWVLMLISLAAVPLALALRKVKLGGPVAMGH